VIVIPMAGLSLRFREAGYQRPKYMLPLHGRSLFHHVLAGFHRCFERDGFLFIYRNVDDTDAFVRAECRELGLTNFDVAVLNRPTGGQAETVALGLEKIGLADDRPITIFNIDTIRKDFDYPRTAWRGTSDGYLEVFRGSGPNWSYVRPASGREPLIAETAEKHAISDLCCDGLYHFARSGDFRKALAEEKADKTSSELYVAPLYNRLIEKSAKIHYVLVEEDNLLFCGVPSEYEALLPAHQRSRLLGGQRC
jgi:hypothetical protein